MNITINSVSLGADGCNHVEISVSAAGHSRVIKMMRAEFQVEPDDIPEILPILIRHIVKTNGWTTGPQIKSGLQGLVVKV